MAFCCSTCLLPLSLPSPVPNVLPLMLHLQDVENQVGNDIYMCDYVYDVTFKVGQVVDVPVLQLLPCAEHPQCSLVECGRCSGRQCSALDASCMSDRQ
jgi:hypothetical protein